MALLVDTHSHLCLEDFRTDLEQVLGRAGAAGVGRAVVVGIDLETDRAAIALAERHSQLAAAVGIHPNDSTEATEATLAELGRLAHNDKVVAIGETGLDYYRKRTPREVQARTFRAHLAIARELALPVIVHNREAHADTLAILKEWTSGVRERRARLGVLHCFSGDAAMAEAAWEMGLYISIAGNVTYPTAHRLVEVVRQVPLSRMVLETDCPFLPPQTLRGQRNEPANLAIVAEKVAEIKAESLETVARATTENAIELFRFG